MRTPAAGGAANLMHEYDPLFDDLIRAIERRVAAQREMAERFPQHDGTGEASVREELGLLEERHAAETDALEDEIRWEKESAESTLHGHLQTLESRHRNTLRQIERRFSDETAQLEQRFHDSTWVTSSVLDDTAEDSPKRQFEKFKTLLLKSREDQTTEWTNLQEEFDTFAARFGWQGEAPVEPQEIVNNRETAQQRFHEVMDEVRGQFEQVRRQWLPKLFTGINVLWVFLVLWGAVFAGLFLFAPTTLFGTANVRMSGVWAGVTATVGAVAALLLQLVAYTLVSMRHTDRLRELRQTIAEAGWIHQQWTTLARDELQARTREFESRQTQVVRQRDTALERYRTALDEQREQIEDRRNADVRTETSQYQQERKALEDSSQTESERLAEDARRRRLELNSRFEQEQLRLNRELNEQTRLRQRGGMQFWDDFKSDWESSVHEFLAAADALQSAAAETFPGWETLARGGWRPSETIPASIPLGRLAVTLPDLEGAVSDDSRLALPQTDVALPAMLPFPGESSLLLKFKGSEGRAAAVKIQQTVLLRMLTLLPPGTIRLTIIDPVGLGENYAGFMHLADYDEQLITSRIWTESSHIDSRLEDLTQHMENVLQKYLRNEFASIEEYNEHAGEVAEPYHILVINDFPSKFSDTAARRLTSIVTSGPRCGVYTLMSVDLAQQLPHNFRLADVQSAMRTLNWKQGAFHTPEGETSRWPLEIDSPPPPDLFTNLVKMVGAASKDARKVEVPFGRIVPKAERWWTSDSRRELDVPLGRAGATKLQHVRLGRGTSQHMLVAGKTGSGKSTFLHGLITNAALHYSPDEVRFYLIDFKKGVEFKDYATYRLPHADVIAIESDREFGVSTLQRLDAVLQERGELFRQKGVQDVAGFREANPDTPMPRILLIVDEFQEFFIEDDKLSQTASLYLDRLVRQGRAFGIHVILGSQTLGGAYSLARSTLGQVAVRVALQCSEADAHLILSEENTAARLLNRPGEAIYNDANGLLQGNHPFQVAWLPDAERERFLQKLERKARETGHRWPPPVVFEGNIPSDPANNPLLSATITGHVSAKGDTAGSATAPVVWLGDAVEIKQPTSLTFHPQAGHHLLLVGQDAAAAFGILATAAVTLAAQSRTSGADWPAVTVFNGWPHDTPEFRTWQAVAATIPGRIRLIAPRDSATVLTELTQELARRDADRETLHPPRFLLIDNITRFRDLRKSEDDYGFGGFGSQATEKPADLGQQFADLVRNGPDSGLHVMVWCDTAASVERALSRGTLKEFEHRVVFQMNAADSSNLIDSPAAAKLGVHRALLHHEETGQQEKFRPYGPPSAEWLAQVASAGQPETSTPDVSPSPQKPPDDLEEPQDLDAFTVT